MELSVIMSTYNESEIYIRQSIESILSQSYGNFEFIVVIDNPGNFKLRNLVERYALEDRRIKIIYNEKNIGLAKSLNRAIQVAAGKYILRMDADDISLEERVSKQLNYIKSNDLDIIGSFIREIDSKGNVSEFGDTYKYRHESICRTLKYKDCIPHPTWMIKKVFTKN